MSSTSWCFNMFIKNIFIVNAGFKFKKWPFILISGLYPSKGSSKLQRNSIEVSLLLT